VIPKVLIVEDDAMIATALSKIFHIWGWTARKALTVADALELLDEDTPHLITLDLQLPDGDGIEVLRAVRSRLPECQPKVFVTTGREPSQLHEVLDLEPDQIIRKPLVLEALQEFADAVWELVQRNRPDPEQWSGVG
jgi:DNA-binding response OmpR family regulator